MAAPRRGDQLEPLDRDDYESLLPDRRSPVTDPTVDTVPTTTTAPTTTTTTTPPTTLAPVLETVPATVAETEPPPDRARRRSPG